MERGGFSVDMPTNNVTKEAKQALRTGNAMEKAAACKTLAELNVWDEEVEELLTGALRHTGWHVRAAAGVALLRLRRADARALVEPLLNDRAFGVREDVGNAWRETFGE